MKLLILDAALGRCTAAIWCDGVVLDARVAEVDRGHAALLPGMVSAVGVGGIDGVAVTVGPGSFTGLRASISLAQGVSGGLGVRLVGVGVAEALVEAVVGVGRMVWVAIDSRRGRVFLVRDGVISVVGVDGLPLAGRGGRVAVAGDAAIAVVSRMAARGDDVMLTDARRPAAWAIGAVAARRLAGGLAAISVQPVYVDPPEAKLPAGGLRPAPR